MALTVTVGRNVQTRKGNGPMDSERWERFTSDVLRIIRNGTSAVYFIGTGQGIYEGTEEESFTVIASDPTGFAACAMRVSLAYIAEVYGQECIAFTEGRTDFVYATRH